MTKLQVIAVKAVGMTWVNTPGEIIVLDSGWVAWSGKNQYRTEPWFRAGSYIPVSG